MCQVLVPENMPWTVIRYKNTFWANMASSPFHPKWLPTTYIQWANCSSMTGYQWCTCYLQTNMIFMTVQYPSNSWKSGSEQSFQIPSFMPHNSGESEQPINCLFHQKRINTLYPSVVTIQIFWCAQMQHYIGILQAFHTYDTT